jgi:lysophospholipase L1-like esterase
MRLLTILTTLSFLFMTACTPALKERNILVIGDSNGANQGWVYQLQELRGGGPLVNTSIGGNTIGFDGMGEMRRNTLENLTSYLRKGYAEMGDIDEILICLGTNDCKAEYANRRTAPAIHLNTLLTRTREFFDERGQDVPRIVLMTPPVAGTDKVLSEEFQGAGACLVSLSADIRAIARREGLCYVDFQDKPGQAILEFSDDGIHFNPEGYKLLAAEVVKACF